MHGQCKFAVHDGMSQALPTIALKLRTCLRSQRAQFRLLHVHAQASQALLWDTEVQVCGGRESA